MNNSDTTSADSLLKLHASFVQEQLLNELPLERMHEFKSKDDLDSILDLFLGVTEDALLCNARFYVVQSSKLETFSSSDLDPGLALVSVGSAGMTGPAYGQIEGGGIIRLENTHSGSFLCVGLKSPVISRTSADCEEPEFVDNVGCIPVYQVSNDCRQVLGEENRIYIDFPVLLEGRVVGKFSCDFCVDDTTLLSDMKLLRCATFAQEAGLAIYAIFLRHRDELVRSAKLIDSVSGADEKWEETLTQIRSLVPSLSPRFSLQLFRGISRNFVDAFAEKWFLERTTDENLEDFIRDGKVFEDGNRIVAVAGNFRRPMRFSDVGNEVLRIRECKQYGVYVNWSPDPFFGEWKNGTSMLIVPVFRPFSDFPIGVCVLSDRSPHFNGFEFRDERLISAILNFSIAEIIGAEAAKDSEVMSREEVYEWLKVSIDPLAEAAEILAECDQKKGRRFNATCCLSQVDNEQSLILIRSTGSLCPSLIASRLPSKGTITREAVYSQGGYIARTCGERDESKSPSILAGAVCESAVAFYNCHENPIGALVVKSDCFDLEDSEKHLRVVATELSRVLKERQIENADSYCPGEAPCS